MISRRLHAAVLALSLYGLSAHANNCDDIDCPQEPIADGCFDQSCELPPENEAPACDGPDCPPIDDCQDPQSCEDPGDGSGETPNYAVSVASDSTVTILSTDITADGQIYVEGSPVKGIATDNQGASVTFDTNGEFSTLEEGVTEEVTFEVYTIGSDVTYATVTVTVTGVAQQEPVEEEPTEEETELSLNAGVITHDTLSRNGELNDGEFVTVWMDTQRLAQGEALVIRDIPEHLEYVETLSTDLPADASSTMPFRTEILSSFYREEGRILRIRPRSGDETSTPVAHVVFKVNISESDDATALLIERLDSTGLEATTTTVEIPPARAAKYYLEVARSSNGALVTAWPPENQEEDFVQLEVSLSSEPDPLTCRDDTTLLAEGLFDGDGSAAADCTDGVISATHTDAKVSATTPLTWPLSFTAENSSTLAASGSIIFSDESSLSLEDSASAAVETAVELVTVKDTVYSRHIPLRMQLPDDIPEATNLTVDLLILPTDPDLYGDDDPQFTCNDGVLAGLSSTSVSLRGESFTTTCTDKSLHIAFPTGMTVTNQSDFSDGLVRIDIFVDNAAYDGNIAANLVTVSHYDESEGPAMAYNELSVYLEEEEEDSLGIIAALLALISFGMYRRRKQVS
ncbi:MAG: hypothetical protein VX245_00960 [Pseudomonadota bacterium]|nr:hypothetical protein [Pseudomonadota bacterium]